MSNFISGLQNPRQLVHWAFNENTEVGDVSPVFDLEGMFVVAALKSKTEKGYPELEDIKDRLTVFVINEVKGEMLAKEMSGFNNDFEQIAQELNLEKVEVNSLTFSSRNIQGFGAENKVIGTIFGLNDSEVSDPIIGNGAVFVVKLSKLMEAPEKENYTQNSTTLENAFTQRVNQDFPYRAIEEASEIEDNRSLFY
jgi:peptidyl-prolyl cis-trans isomerase D